MNRHRLIGQRLIALAGSGFFLFNYPILALFSVDGFIFGVPVFYAYLFSVWAAFIWFAAFFVERG